MVGANLKAQTIRLMVRRTALEEKMNAIIERLNRSGGPGISGDLVDSEGFPRTDIDIPSVRADRHKLSELHGDYKDVTEKLNQNIELLHSTRLAPETAKETAWQGHGLMGYAQLGRNSKSLARTWTDGVSFPDDIIDCDCFKGFLSNCGPSEC